VLAGGGLFIMSLANADGTYLGNLLPAIVPMSIGMGMTFLPLTLVATSGVSASDAGLASGLFNTSQQVGGALGLAILSTLAADRTSNALADGGSAAVAAVDGFQIAFLVGAVFALVGAILAFLFVRPSQADVEQAEPVPAGA
jgi:sugar phosphate permease